MREKNSADVRIIDEHISSVVDGMIEDELKKLSTPRMVGISCLTINSKRAFDLAKRIKQVAPQVVIVLGGIHPTVLPEECLQRAGFDIRVLNYME